MLKLEVPKIYNPNIYVPKKVHNSPEVMRFGVTVRLADLPEKLREDFEKKYPVYTGFVQTGGERERLIRMNASHAPEVEFSFERKSDFSRFRRDWVETLLFYDACNVSRDQVFTANNDLTFTLHVEEWQHPITQRPLISLRKIGIVVPG